MELPIDVLEQIENYITHQLPDDQRRAIEQRMEQDPDFRETVQALQKSRTFLDRAVRLDQVTQNKLIQMSRAIMNQLDAQEPTFARPAHKTARVPIRSVGAWSFAMAAMVLLIGGVYLAISPVQLANADLDAGVHRDAMQAPVSGLRPAERQALNDFLTANAFYTNGDFEKAIVYYTKAENGPISAYLREAIWWNLSLAYLKTGDTTKAQQYWQQYESLEERHYPSTYLDRTRIRTRLFWEEIFA